MMKLLPQLITFIISGAGFALWLVEEDSLRVLIVGSVIFLMVLIIFVQTDWFAIKFLKNTRPSFKFLGNWEGIISFDRYGEDIQKEFRIAIEYHNGALEIKTKLNNINSSTISKALYSDIENSLMYSYISKPKNLAMTTKNPIHYGTVLLKLMDKDSIHGTYFTSRRTDGQILLNRVAKKKKGNA